MTHLVCVVDQHSPVLALAVAGLSVALRPAADDCLLPTVADSH